MEESGKKILNLGIGSPDLPPHESVIDELARLAHDPKNHGYNAYQGQPAFRQAVRAFYAEHYQVHFTEEDTVLPLMGSKECISHISLAYLNEGDEVLVPALGYPTYTSVTRMVGGHPVFYPLTEDNGWQPDWDFLENRNCSRVKLMWINYPHMPSGARASEELFQRLVDFARRKNILLCHDNPYSFILNEKPLSIFSVAGAREVALELNSLSKTFNMAGWRVGWVMGAHELVQPVLQIKSNMDSGMFKPVQLAAVKALELGEGWFEQLQATYRPRQELVFRICEKLGCSFTRDQAGLFVWAKARQGSGEALSDHLLYEKGVFVTPGMIFGEPGRAYIRISLCAAEEVLEEVVRRIS